jgi:hypothetical protein
MFERSGRADYDSLQVLFRTRLAKSFNLQAAYTYSKSQADFGLGDSNGTQSDFAILDNTDRDADFAKSDINRPHIFVAHFIYNLPKFNGANAFVKTILGGWETTAIIQATSGTSVTPRINATGIRDFSSANGFQAGITGLGTAVANQRPLRVEGQPCTINGPTGTFINPNAFTLVGYKIGQTNPRKTTCLGPPTKNVDFTLSKNFSPSWLKNSFFGEQSRLQLRVEFFNAFNSPQFRGDGGSFARVFYSGTIRCGTAACSPTNNTITGAVDGNGNAVTPYNNNFGVSTRTRGGREIQYALKFYF